MSEGRFFFAVLDASFVLAWGFGEADFDMCRDLMRQAARHGALAPAPFAGEVMEGLLKGVRRKRYTLEDAWHQAAVVQRLRITEDDGSWDSMWEATRELAVRHKLSAYDASYLETAKRVGLPLVTLDKALREAARLEHVLVLPQAV